MEIHEIGLHITIPSFIIYISPLKSIDFIKIFSVVMLLKSPDTAIFSLSHLGRNVHFFLFFWGEDIIYATALAFIWSIIFLIPIHTVRSVNISTIHGRRLDFQVQFRHFTKNDEIKFIMTQLKKGPTLAGPNLLSHS